MGMSFNLASMISPRKEKPRTKSRERKPSQRHKDLETSIQWLVGEERDSHFLTHSELRPQNIYSQEEMNLLFYHQVGNTNFFIFITNQ